MLKYDVTNASLNCMFISPGYRPALFFKTFRHCDVSDGLGIPIFPLSRNEKRHQAKYSDDESTLSEGSTAATEEDFKCNFSRLDANREKRKSVLFRPIDIQSEHTSDTAKRSNMSDMSSIIQKSMRNLKVSNKPLKRTKSDVDEIASSVSDILSCEFLSAFICVPKLIVISMIINVLL